MEKFTTPMEEFTIGMEKITIPINNLGYLDQDTLFCYPISFTHCTTCIYLITRL